MPGWYELEVGTADALFSSEICVTPGLLWADLSVHLGRQRIWNPELFGLEQPEERISASTTSPCHTPCPGRTGHRKVALLSSSRCLHFADNRATLPQKEEVGGPSTWREEGSSA